MNLKTGFYEVTAALGLIGVVEFYLSIRHNALIISPALVLGELIALYVLIAVASETMIVSGLRPTTRQSAIFNVLVAAIIVQLVWRHPSELKGLAGIAVATGILRLLVSMASLRTSRASVRRFTSILVGGPLLLGSAWTGINLAEDVYYSYYLFPKFKEGYIMPTRWQDILALVVLWGATILLLYVSYRLLKYAFRRKAAVMT